MLAVEDTFIELKNIRKVFGDVIALDDVNLTVKKSEIHGLLGENGAGKTTLMNILYGLYSPDKGDIYIEGKKVKINSPFDSINLGIGMVHQVSTLVPEFTAVENIILGTPENKWSFSTKQEKEKIEKLMQEFGLNFPLDIKVKEVPAGEKQKIEIIRALYRNAKILILDEPTTSLVESEFEQLLKSLRVLVDKGLSVIFITHKIKEVIEACDSVTVLRKGRVQGTLSKGEMCVDNLIKLMFMEKDIKVTESALPKVELSKAKRSEKPVCVLKDVTLHESEQNRPLRNISFEVYGGEIFGIASVSGNGEKELANVIINPCELDGGEIFVNGEKINNKPTLSVFGKGVFYTPEDRIKEGILNEGNLKENILLGHQAEKRFLKNSVFIDWNEVKEVTKKIIQEYNVAAPNEDISIRRLSGGNIQKVIIGRAFVSPINLLVTHNPTSGLDIATVEFIFNKLVEMKNNGGAVLLINEDLDELMLLSDRIAVLHNGEIKKIFERKDFDKYRIGLIMVGG